MRPATPMSRLHFMALPALFALIGAAPLGDQRDSLRPENPEATEFRGEQTHQQIAMLPPPIGQDLTLSPSDMPDISCYSVELK